MKFIVKQQGIDELSKEFNDLLLTIDKAMAYGLSAVAADLPTLLQRHIQQDVYEVYSPQDYLRRSEYPQYGIPLNDIRNIYSQANTSAKQVVFQYYPTGVHTLYEDNPDYPPSISGDELIEVLESGNGYSWEVGKMNIPPRPFWSNFVREVIEGGMAEQSFVNGFNSYGDKDMRAIRDGKIQRDGNETEF